MVSCNWSVSFVEVDKMGGKLAVTSGCYAAAGWWRMRRSNVSWSCWARPASTRLT